VLCQFAYRPSQHDSTRRDGRDVQDEQESAYYEIFDEMTQKWDNTLKEKSEWLMPPQIAGEPGAVPANPNGATRDAKKVDKAPVKAEAMSE
jgi:hypothetical protein